MIYTLVMDELILQMEQNALNKKQKESRLSVETSILKCERLLNEIQHIDETNAELNEMLIEACLDGICTRQLIDGIPGIQQ